MTSGETVLSLVGTFIGAGTLLLAIAQFRVESGRRAKGLRDEEQSKVLREQEQLLGLTGPASLMQRVVEVTDHLGVAVVRITAIEDSNSDLTDLVQTKYGDLEVKLAYMKNAHELYTIPMVQRLETLYNAQHERQGKLADQIRDIERKIDRSKGSAA